MRRAEISFDGACGSSCSHYLRAANGRVMVKTGGLKFINYTPATAIARDGAAREVKGAEVGVELADERNKVLVARNENARAAQQRARRVDALQQLRPLRASRGEV